MTPVPDSRQTAPNRELELEVWRIQGMTAEEFVVDKLEIDVMASASSRWSPALWPATTARASLLVNGLWSLALIVETVESWATDGDVAESRPRLREWLAAMEATGVTF